MFIRFICIMFSLFAFIATSNAADITAAKFLPGGKKIITGGSDGTLKIYDLKGKEIKSLSIRGDFKDISSNGKKIAALDFGNIVVYNLKGEKLIKIEVGFDKRIIKIKFSKNGKKIIAGTQNGAIYIYNLKGKMVKTLEAHKSSIQSISVRKGAMLTTAYGEKKAILWTFKKKNKVKKKEIKGFNLSPNVAELGPGKKRIIASGNDKILYCMKRNGKLLWKTDFLGNMFLAVDMKFLSKGKKILVGSMDGAVDIWSGKGKKIKSIKAHNGDLQGIEVAGKGNVWLSRTNNELIIWKNFKKLATIKAN